MVITKSNIEEHCTVPFEHCTLIRFLTSLRGHASVTSWEAT